MDAKAFLEAASAVFYDVHAAAVVWKNRWATDFPDGMKSTVYSFCRHEFNRQLIGRTGRLARIAVDGAPSDAAELVAVVDALRALIDRFREIADAHDASGDDRVFLESWPSLMSAADAGRRAIREATQPDGGESSDGQQPAGEVGEAASGTLTGEEKALALLVKHPDWSDKKIAEAAGVARTSLYRWDRYRQAREAMEAGREEKPHGARDRDGNLEAWDAE